MTRALALAPGITLSLSSKTSRVRMAAGSSSRSQPSPPYDGCLWPRVTL